MDFDELILLSSYQHKFEIIVDAITIVDKKNYMKRGFTVYEKQNSIIISWRNPKIEHEDLIHKPLLTNNFTAQSLYLSITNYKNLTMLSPRIINSRLLRGEVINEFYGVHNNAIQELYYELIQEVIMMNKPIYILCGVISLKKIYENSIIIDTLPLLPLSDSNFLIQ